MFNNLLMCINILRVSAENAARWIPKQIENEQNREIIGWTSKHWVDTQ